MEGGKLSTRSIRLEIEPCFAFDPIIPKRMARRLYVHLHNTYILESKFDISIEEAKQDPYYEKVLKYLIPFIEPLTDEHEVTKLNILRFICYIRMMSQNANYSATLFPTQAIGEYDSSVIQRIFQRCYEECESNKTRRLFLKMIKKNTEEKVINPETTFPYEFSEEQAKELAEREYVDEQMNRLRDFHITNIRRLIWFILTSRNIATTCPAHMLLSEKSSLVRSAHKKCRETMQVDAKAYRKQSTADSHRDMAWCIEYVQKELLLDPIVERITGLIDADEKTFRSPLLHFRKIVNNDGVPFGPLD